jgi:hypothetical protein
VARTYRCWLGEPRHVPGLPHFSNHSQCSVVVGVGGWATSGAGAAVATAVVAIGGTGVGLRVGSTCVAGAVAKEVATASAATAASSIDGVARGAPPWVPFSAEASSPPLCMRRGVVGGVWLTETVVDRRLHLGAVALPCWNAMEM